MPCTSPRRTRHARIVILGGGYAGLTAAARLGSQNRGLDIRLVDRDARLVERIRLHQIGAGQTIATWDRRDFLASRGVEFEQATVEALDTDRTAVHVRDLDGTVRALPYDVLIYALGSRTTLPFPAAAGVHALGSPEDADAIRRIAGRATRILIAGAGATGIETVCEFAESFPAAHVTLATAGTFEPTPAPGGFADAAMAHVSRTLNRLGVELLVRTRIIGADRGVALTQSGLALPFDLLVWTAGFDVPSLPSRLGFAVGPGGRIRADASLRSISHPDIIAVGDSAEASTERGGPCRMSCATALSMGAAGARTAQALVQGHPPPAFEFEYVFRNVSLGRADAVVQFVDSADRPLDLVWTGQRAAQWKEYVAQTTLATVGLTKLPAVPSWPPIGVLASMLRARRYHA